MSVVFVVCQALFLILPVIGAVPMSTAAEKKADADMVRVPAGEFFMGSDDGPQDERRYKKSAWENFPSIAIK